MSQQYGDVNNQLDATTFSFINLFKSALHVSGGKFAHFIVFELLYLVFIWLYLFMITVHMSKYF